MHELAAVTCLDRWEQQTQHGTEAHQAQEAVCVEDKLVAGRVPTPHNGVHAPHLEVAGHHHLQEQVSSDHFCGPKPNCNAALTATLRSCSQSGLAIKRCLAIPAGMLGGCFGSLRRMSPIVAATQLQTPSCARQQRHVQLVVQAQLTRRANDQCQARCETAFLGNRHTPDCGICAAGLAAAASCGCAA